MNEALRYRGRAAQTWIYLKKLVRMFVYQNDWKMLPMSALIAGLVTFAVGGSLFHTQEGTFSGCFALVCVCIWNGFFNSIQSVCRERPVIKREHRSGLHITSYITAHMIYQAVLCILETVILLFICNMAGIAFPTEGVITPVFLVDYGISMFLITYAADMMSLMISSLVRNTTTAMTVMPFMLIFQLIFSGGFVKLEGPAANLKGVTAAKWGLQNLCALSDYNNQPMVTLWNTIWKFRSLEIGGQQPIKMMTDYIAENNMRDQILLECGKYNLNPDYVKEAGNILHCWGMLLVIIVVFALLSVILLEFIDRDKR